MEDRAQAEEFLSALDPCDNSFTFQTFDDVLLDDGTPRKDETLIRVLNGTLAEHWNELVELNNRGAGIYVTVNRTDLQGRKKENIVGIRATFIDLDGSPLEPVQAEGVPRPIIINETSPGRWHVYWRAPDNMPLDKFTDLQKQLIAYFHSDKNVNDLSRVMRIPGFVHRKREPFDSHIIYINEEAEPPDWASFLPKPEPEKPRPDYKPNGGGPGDDDLPRQWDHLNQIALQNLGAWVPTLYPSAKRYGSTYRVSSKDLGRNLEEDLSFSPQGIKDFGLADMGDPNAGGRTPIRSIRDRFNCDFKYAVRWLCEQLGEDPAKYLPPPRPEPGPQPQPEPGPKPQPPPSLPYIDLALDPIPPRDWLVQERIPMRNVSMLSGEGAMGKSILLMQLAGAVVLGKYWCGAMPEPGPVLFISAEEDDLELCRRMEAVAQHFDATRQDMIDAGLRVLSFAGLDALLGVPDRAGVIKPTPLFEALKRDAVQQRPKLIVVDPVADVFAGKEMDRAQTREFITMLRGLAMEVGAAVVISAHPSLTGIKSDTGLSGSTAWHNSVRARMYLKAAGDDTDLRVMECKKSNYSRLGETVVLRWKDGVYVVEPGVGTLQRLAAEQKINELFMTLLQRCAAQGRNVSDKTGTSYAPAKFAKSQEAIGAKITSKDFADAMERLFTAGKIRVVTEGPPSHPRTRLTAVDTASTDPSTDLPPPSTDPAEGVCVPPPYNPPAGGSRQEGRWKPPPAPPGEVEGVARTVGHRPRTLEGYQAIGVEPDGTTCRQCGEVEGPVFGGGKGPVYLIRNPYQGVRSEPLHEGCAKAWFTKAT